MPPLSKKRRYAKSAMSLAGRDISTGFFKTLKAAILIIIEDEIENELTHNSTKSGTYFISFRMMPKAKMVVMTYLMRTTLMTFAKRTHYSVNNVKQFFQPKILSPSGDQMVPPLISEEEAIARPHITETFWTEGAITFWMENGKRKLLPKSRGTSIIVSGFMCACHGFMCAELNGVLCKSYQLFEAGKAREGWFNNADLNIQFKACHELFRHFHPFDDCELWFGSDDERIRPKHLMDWMLQS